MGGFEPTLPLIESSDINPSSSLLSKIILFKLSPDLQHTVQYIYTDPTIHIENIRNTKTAYLGVLKTTKILFCKIEYPDLDSYQ